MKTLRYMRLFLLCLTLNWTPVVNTIVLKINSWAIRTANQVHYNLNFYLTSKTRKQWNLSFILLTMFLMRSLRLTVRQTGRDNYEAPAARNKTLGITYCLQDKQLLYNSVESCDATSAPSSWLSTHSHVYNNK